MKPLRIAALLLVSFAFVLPLAHTVRAQQAERAPMSDSKRQVILDLIDLVNQRVSFAGTVDTIMRELDTVFATSYEEQIRASNEFTPQEKERLIKDAAAMSAKISARFRERFTREVDFQKLQQNLMLDLYDRYFTEQELIDLVAFYKTPTGQKTLIVMPQLMGDSIRLSNELIGTQVNQISREVIQEVFDEIRPKKGKATRR